MIPSLVSPELNKALLATLSDKEIKTTVFQLDANKAPGPDRFSGLFYQYNWATVGPSLYCVVRNFYENRYLLKEIN